MVRQAEGGATPLDELGLAPEGEFVPPPEIDTPIPRRKARKELAAIEAQLGATPENPQGLAKDHPRRTELELERDLILARERSWNERMGMSSGWRDKYTHRPFLGNDAGRTVVNADLGVVGDVSARIGDKLDDYDDAVEQLVAAQRGGDVTRAQRVEGKTVEELRANVNRLRDDLVAETAPLRTGIGADLDTVQESIRAHDRAQLSDANRALLNMSDEDAKLADDTVDRLHAAFRSSFDTAFAHRASAVSFMSPEQQRVLQLQKQFLGTEDSIVGASTMTPLSTVTNAIFGNDDGAHMRVREMLGETCHQ